MLSLPLLLGVATHPRKTTRSVATELLATVCALAPFSYRGTFLAPQTIVRRSLSDTNLSGVRRPAAYVNFFKLLLLLHFSMDSFETRYTYFLGQSPNFVLFRILKFGFSDFFLMPTDHKTKFGAALRSLLEQNSTCIQCSHSEPVT